MLSKLSSVPAFVAVTPVIPLPSPDRFVQLTFPLMFMLPVPLNVPVKLSFASLRKKLPEFTPSSVSASNPLPVPSLAEVHTV